MKRAAGGFHIVMPALLMLALPMLAFPARAQMPEMRAADCGTLGQRFERLVAIYLAAAEKLVAETGDIGKALARARARAIAGEGEATIPMTGLPWLLRAHSERYTVASVRQICTLAERNGLPLHIATCAYFTALNPLGEREEKRQLVARRIAGFEALPAPALRGPNAPAHLAEDMAFLKTCLPPD